MNTIIKLEDVWKRYEIGETGLNVLRDINLEIKEGEFVSITGSSGSGKSTLIHIMGTLDSPSWGKVYLKERSILRMGENSLASFRAKAIGFIFQQFNLIPTFTALENVMMPMFLIGIPDKKSRERAESLLNMVGLGNRLYHKPTELSGGQQQRVAIARALANDPEIILADEPTGNLDTKSGKFVMEFLKELNDKGKTIVLVTHELSLLEYAYRIVSMKDGRIEKINKRR